MKRTLTINISGIVFHIDEDAFEKLQIYLKSLNSKFGGSEEGREIITDIEARIAEIFTEKTKDKKNVITEADVDQVIEIMGMPEDFESTAEEDEHEGSRYEYRKNRRLYRDPENKIISGVCGGLASYFNIDPVAVRVIFVILFFFPTGLSLLTYLILWIVVPVARTTAQKLEMRGEKVTISNIEKSIKDEFKNVKDNYKDYRKSKSYENTRDGLNRFFEVIGIIIKGFIKAIVILIGAVIILVGIAIIIALVMGLFVGGVANVHFWGLEFGPISPLLSVFTDPSMVWLFTIGLIIVTLVPLFAIVYGGLKLIFKFKTNDRMIGLSALGLWLIALGTLMVIAMSEVGNFRTTARSTESHFLDSSSTGVLYIKASPANYDEFDFFGDRIDLDNMMIVEENDEVLLLGRPELDIVQASGDQIEMEFKKKARGKSRDEARENSEKIKYHWEMKDSLVIFDPYFQLPEGEKWRNQEFEIVIKLPVGKTVYIDYSMIDIIYDIDNISNTYDRKMVDKYWTMKPEGLSGHYTE